LKKYLDKKEWKVRDSFVSEYLEEGEHYVFKPTLFMGLEYKILGVSDDDTVKDIDIIIYDENYNLIDKDYYTDSIPIISVTPRWTGTFYVCVIMSKGYGCSGAMIWYR
jgi:hypothetical protein